MRTKELATTENNVGPVTMLTIPISTPSSARINSECGNESKKLPDLSRTVRFDLVLNNPSFTDPVLIIHYGNYHDGDPTRLGFQTCIPVEQTGNHYSFDLGENLEMQYFSIRFTEKLAARKQRSYLFQYYHFEPGDNMRIAQHGLEGTAKGVKLSFMGKGADKYLCQYDIENNLLPIPVMALHQKDSSTKQADVLSNTKMQLAIIEKYTSLLSVDSYQLLKLDVICRAERERIISFQEQLSLALTNKDQKAFAAISAGYHKQRETGPFMDIPANIKYKSREYAWFMVVRSVCDYLDEYQHINYMGVYYEIMKTEDADLRDRMIVAFFILYYRDFRSYYRPLADHAATHIQNAECLEMFVFLQHRSYCKF